VSENRRALWALYLTRFGAGFGVITLLTLLPEFVDAFDPTGLQLGLFTAGLTLAQTVAVVPLAHWADVDDKRRVLLASLGVSVAAYVGFTLVDSSWSFIAARGAQGIAITGTGLLTLAMVGELSPPGETANTIGKANAARFLASIVGTLAAGSLYEAYGFDVVFWVLVALLAPALVAVWLFVDPDQTRAEGFKFDDLALNRRIVTLSTFRFQYAFAVTMVRTWVPIYAGVEATRRGGLEMGAVAVSVVIAAEKATNMVCQPYTGRLSDRFGRGTFVAVGGAGYGLVALAIPLAPAAGTALAGTLGGAPSIPLVGVPPAAFLPLVGLNALLGVADSFREPASMALFAEEGTDAGGVASSFGVRELVWRPGSVIGPLVAGFLTTGAGIVWVFVVGAATAITGVAAFLVASRVLLGEQSVRDW
jgi:MFS family permease